MGFVGIGRFFRAVCLQGGSFLESLAFFQVFWVDLGFFSAIRGIYFFYVSAITQA